MSMTTFVSLVSGIVQILKYTPEAYEAVKKIIAVWEEQTGETVTDEQWATIDDLLKSADEYVAGDDG